ncbi:MULTISPECIES: hypothetical protein [unclassified Mesorhizobium]|uniref:hypothetical protein n=1 Tax=unclassified Mesorhizobium TaxID=325217 RepID=UPI00112AD631|nr:MULTISPECIES: hypothetical protein [unclassified Mesorhizobium]TPK90555.1 hypothetical protein FJ548_07285 [Mesorhizobium sp. B2-4-17]TPK98879.1 hypothetical protein FJ938_24755 [Mesorhizobium sp. B2-4-14]
MPKGYKGREKTERLHMLISPEEIAAIDDWRLNNRVGTRAEAVRRLVQIGRNFDAVSQTLAREAYAAVDKIDCIANEISKSGIEQQPTASRVKIGEQLREAAGAQHTLAALLGAIDEAGRMWRLGPIDEAGKYTEALLADVSTHQPQKVTTK